MSLLETLLPIVQCQDLELVCLTKGACAPDQVLMTAVEYQHALGCTCEPGSTPSPHPQAHVLCFLCVCVFNFM